MFMKKAGIPVAKSTVVIFVRTIMSILFLIIVVPFFMNVDSSVKGWVPMYVIVTVSLIFTAMPIAAVYLMHTQYPQSIIYSCTRHFSHELRRKCFIWYQDFQEASFIMGQRPDMVLKAFCGIRLKLGLYLCHCAGLFYRTAF
jgi:hypothetical protein